MKKAWKQSFFALTALTLVSVPSTAAAALNQPRIQVTLDGNTKTFPVAPYLSGSTVMVPLRQFAIDLGLSVQWEADEPDFVTVYKNTATIQFEVGSQNALVNNKEVHLAQAPQLVQNTILVPLRLLAETFGASVKWNAQTNTVQVAGVQQVITLPLDSEPQTLDPAKATDSNTITVLTQLNDGLIRLDAHSEPVPGIADAWDISKDGLTYTFHLRPDAQWSDGSPVTAQDFVYGWQRALNPQTKSDYAFLLFDIKNAEDYNLGRTTAADQVGVKALDDHTLQIVLNQPEPYFTQLLAMPVFFPEKQSFVEKIGNQYGTSPDTVLTDGPFQATSWVHEQSLRLIKSPTYWDKANVALSQVNMEVVHDSAAQESLYETGQLDHIDLMTADQIQRYKNSPQFDTVQQPIVGYLNFNEKDKVLSNPKIRQALSYAIDADQAAPLFYDGSAVGATGLVPTGISDGHSGDFRQDTGDLIDRKDNAVKAKQLLAEGLQELGLPQFPSLKLMSPDTAQLEQGANFIQQQWKQTLGIDVQMDFVPFKLVLQRQTEHNYDIGLFQWGADYNDPMTFLDLFSTGNAFNDSEYSNSTYDQRIAQAKQELDTQKRMQDLADAEKILMQDMPCAPIFFRNQNYLQKPYVKNWMDHTFGAEYDLKYTYIEGK